ncbi:MAG: T9SS type A sorting domain-containing protein [Balneolaceae bacterium]
MYWVKLGAIICADPDGINIETLVEFEYCRQSPNLPAQTQLPNPFKKGDIFEYTVPASMEVHLAVYNSLGQEVALLANNRIQQSGQHKVIFDASGLTGGIYFYGIQADQFTLTRKKTLMK